MAESSRSEMRWFLLFFLAVFFVRLYFQLSIGYAADDALITFRYARNLVAGDGFVYNEGERILGTTTPLFTLLISGFLMLGTGPFVAAFLLNSLADLVTALCLWRVFHGTSLGPGTHAGSDAGADQQFHSPGVVSWIPSLLYLLSPETLQWSLSGMETELYISFLFLAFLLASRDSWRLAFVAGAFATLTRIDGAAVLVALTAAHVLRRGRLPAAPLAAATGVLLPWVVFAFLYFGSPVPNSAAAKWALSGQNPVAAGLRILLVGFLHLNTAGLPILILAVLGTREVARRRRQWLPLAIWTWGYALSYTLAAGPMHPWYYAPFYAGYLPLAWIGWLRLVSGLPRRIGMTLAAGCIALIIVLFMSYYRTYTLRQDHSGINAVNRRAGEWIAAHAPPGSVVAFKDIGFAGYYSRRKVLDLAGLISPECVPYRVQGDFLGPIRAFRPRFFAFSEGQARNLQLDRSDLLQSYRLAAEIREGTGSFRIYELR